MAALYGRHYSSRYRAITDLIKPGSSVLDLCCGPGVLYRRYLRHKSVNYTGLDVNANFIKTLVRSGAKGEVRDLRTDDPLPLAEYVIMQASLYHFLPDPGAIVNRMLAAAQTAVIIAEPIRNLACSNLPLVHSITRSMTDPGLGAQPLRFTEQTLDELLSGYCQAWSEAFVINGGREKIYLIPGMENSERI